MKVRIQSYSSSPYVWDIPLSDMEDYLRLLCSHELYNDQGELLKVIHVAVDVYQNAVDIATSKVEP
jgi:hypothetical protein